MKPILLTLLLCSCTQQQHDGKDMNPLPRYSDMGAASDAGQTPSQP